MRCARCSGARRGDPEFLAGLARHGAVRAPLFAPEREWDAWRRLLDGLV